MGMIIKIPGYNVRDCKYFTEFNPSTKNAIKYIETAINNGFVNCDLVFPFGAKTDKDDWKFCEKVLKDYCDKFEVDYKYDDYNDLYLFREKNPFGVNDGLSKIERQIFRQI